MFFKELKQIDYKDFIINVEINDKGKKYYTILMKKYDKNIHKMIYGLEFTSLIDTKKYIDNIKNGDFEI